MKFSNLFFVLLLTSCSSFVEPSKPLDLSANLSIQKNDDWQTYNSSNIDKKNNVVESQNISEIPPARVYSSGNYSLGNQGLETLSTNHSNSAWGTNNSSKPSSNVISSVKNNINVNNIHIMSDWANHFFVAEELQKFNDSLKSNFISNVDQFSFYMNNSNIAYVSLSKSEEKCKSYEIIVTKSDNSLPIISRGSSIVCS